MPSFEVTITQIENYEFEIEAETEKEAKQKAHELFDKNKHDFHTDSGGTTEAFEL
jgi:hypothetical protein